MLLQIHEPGQTPVPHEENDITAVGIDLGTTNSLVAVVKNNNVEILEDDDGRSLHPSVVAYLEGDKVITGDVDSSGGNVVHSIKRLMGKGAEDVQKIKHHMQHDVADDKNILRLSIGNKTLTPVEISAQILKSLKNIANKSLGKIVKKAVITVPAYFDDSARTATKDAASLAGLEVIRLVNEPTAAALAYGLDKKCEGVYAVYDLGGGTFDVSVLRMQKGVFQVLATGGSTEIGGDDFDREIMELCIWQCRDIAKSAITPLKSEIPDLLRVSRETKEYLTEHKERVFNVTVQGQEFTVKITREAFEQALLPFVNATIDIFKQVLLDSTVIQDEVEGVVLVGGSTRLPLVKQMVAEFIGREPLCDIDPDKVVAHGAALQADGLTNGSDNLLLDVIPLSLGLETMGELVEKVIHRNTPIPVSKAQEFTTYQDGQTGMVIHVVQGEREMVSKNRSLAKFELKNIPPMNAGVARVKVTFSVDADALLTVSACEEVTGAEQKIEVKPSYGLSEEEIKNMLYESMQNGQEDMQERLLAQAKLDANRVVIAVKSAMQEDSDLLDRKDQEELEASTQILQKLLLSSDRDKIIEATKKLASLSEHFADLRMNKYIVEALKGKKI